MHRNKRTGEIFYVGSGRYSRSYEKSQRTQTWKDIVRDDGFSTEIVADDLTKEESLYRELDLYNSLLETQPLVNQHPPHVPNRYPVESIKNNLIYDETSPTCLRWSSDATDSSVGIRHRAGDVAGNQTSVVRKVRIDGKSLVLHKVVWILHNSDVLPGIVIDHIDGDNLNNRIENLRAVTQAENARNEKSCGRNKVGINGVVLFVRKGRTDQWRAQYRNLDGVVTQKYFSILRLGKEEAFRQACEWRKEQIELLNSQGAGYTERHGT